MIKNKTHTVFNEESPAVPMLTMNDSVSTHRSKGYTERLPPTAPRKVEKSLLTKEQRVHLSTDDQLVMDWQIGRKTDNRFNSPTGMVFNYNE